MNASLEPGGKASKHQDIDRLVAELALKGVFLRGYQLRCPACDLQRWYSLQDVAETMQCVGCLTRIQPPIEAPSCFCRSLAGIASYAFQAYR